MKPRLYLTSAATVQAVRSGRASAETRAMVGPGPVYSAMRLPDPRRGQTGEGRVLAFTPTKALLLAAREAAEHTDHCKTALTRDGECECGRETEAWARYETALRQRWARHAELHRPGALAAYVEAPDGTPWDRARWRRVAEVENGSTIICNCPRERVARGRCHLCVAASFLAESWDVRLNGAPWAEWSAAS